MPRQAPPPPTGEKRSGADRRLGDRRVNDRAVLEDRRLGPDPRGRVPRRESAEAHLRNAVQLLELLMNEKGLSRAQRDTVNGVLRRVGLALREAELLARERADLARRLRREIDRPTGGEETAG